MKRSLFAALIALATVLPAAPAQADVESWNWSETRFPLTDGRYGLPHSLRLFTDARFGGRYAGGLGQLFFRVGPIWELHPNLFLGVHGTVYPNQYNPTASPGAFETVLRPEFEPNLRGRFGDFTFNDRNRLEYAYSPTRPGASFWRYRNQLRVNYQPAGAPGGWFPYVWDEVMIPFDAGFNQNRASVGLAFPLSEHSRLELGYILRSRAGGAGAAWEQDHVLNVYLFYAPRHAAPFAAEMPAGSGE